MPLPLLVPIALGATAVGSALFGAKKGYDAYQDYSEASDTNNEAVSIYNDATEKLNEKRKKTNKFLEKIGNLKIKIYKESLEDFVDIFSDIKNIDFEDNLDTGANIKFEDDLVAQINNTIIEIRDVLGGGAASVASAALAGFGAYGGVGLLASASTGTAISSLSGVAATNATLAWLGGGSLATGGLGMAGGTAILGGIVAAPVLAVGGFVASKTAKKAKIEAQKDLQKARAASESMEVAHTALDAILSRTAEFKEILIPLNNIFIKYIEDLDSIVIEETDYQRYSDKEKKIVFTSVSIAQTIKNICDTPILDENGNIARKSQRVLRKANKFLNTIKDI